MKGVTCPIGSPSNRTGVQSVPAAVGLLSLLRGLLGRKPQNGQHACAVHTDCARARGDRFKVQGSFGGVHQGSPRASRSSSSKLMSSTMMAMMIMMTIFVVAAFVEINSDEACSRVRRQGHNTDTDTQDKDIAHLAPFRGAAAPAPAPATATAPCRDPGRRRRRRRQGSRLPRAPTRPSRTIPPSPPDLPCTAPNHKTTNQNRGAAGL